MKKIICQILILCLVCFISVSSLGDSVFIYRDKRSGKTSCSYKEILCCGWDEDECDAPHYDDFNPDSFTSSKPSIAQISWITSYAPVTPHEYRFYDGIYDYSWMRIQSDGVAVVFLDSSKAGTTTISFKCGEETYRTKVNMLKYTNPVGTITLTGVEKSKDFRKKTASAASVKTKVTQAVQRPTLAVRAASGWSILSIYYTNGTGAGIRDFKFGTDGLDAITMYVPKLEKGQSTGYLEIKYINQRNKATITTKYTFGSN